MRQRPFGRGTERLFEGPELLTMATNHVSKSWDDPNGEVRG